MTATRPTTDPERLDAHAHLMRALHHHVAGGRPIPCMDPSAAWAWTTEDDPEANYQAATLCLACPALRDCRSYVTAHSEPVGVWAAMTPKQRRKAERKSA